MYTPSDKTNNITVILIFKWTFTAIDYSGSPFPPHRRKNNAQVNNK